MNKRTHLSNDLTNTSLISPLSNRQGPPGIAQTARRRGNPQLHARSSGQPEPDLRPVHHARPLWLQQPRAAERFAIASLGPRCAFASCCARKINGYRHQYADNHNISFLPAIVSTSTRMHGEFLRLLFLQAHRETEAHFTDAGMPSQRNQSDSFRFKRGILPVAEEQSRTRGGQSSGITDQPQFRGLWHSRSPSARSHSRSPSSPPPSFTQSPSAPRSLVRDGQTSPHRPRLVVSRSTCPPLFPPPRFYPEESYCASTRAGMTHVHLLNMV
jgi:hypothetical protein